MAELLVDFITSLDGYAAAEGWPGYWGLEGPEYLAGTLVNKISNKRVDEALRRCEEQKRAREEARGK